MANALKVINKRANQLHKRHPGKKRATLLKQAGKEYRAGKLSGKKKRRTVARANKIVVVGAVKRKTRKRKLQTVPKRKRVYKAKRVSVKSYKAKRYRRIAGKGSSVTTALLVGGGLIAGYLLLKNFTTPAPTTIPAAGYFNTGNQVRDNNANVVLSYATAAGLTLTAIAKLISVINSSSDSQVSSAASNPGSFVSANIGDGSDLYV